MRKHFAALAFLSLIGAAPVAAQPYVQLSPRVTMEDVRDIALEQGVVAPDQVWNEGYRWGLRGRDQNGRWVQMYVDSKTGAILWMQRH
jgi:hypothetical protein